ncbi:hypothetical protein N665_0193s0002 [Sinapis alba]|nr:hypothetical protein N665_0193s0002 [Sinapis alba]
MGAHVDHTVTGTSGPFTYLVNGQIIHRIGSLLPEDGAPPEYLQLYIFDTENELENRKRAFTQGSSSLDLPDSVIRDGGLIVGDLSATSVGRDIMVELKSSTLQRISDLHPLMMSLQYPLLFPYGETGYSERLPYAGPAVSKVRRDYMMMREFYAYQIQTRPTEGMGIIKDGRLLHQYIVDAYTATEQERLRFISLNQKKLRADLYSNVCDAVESGDADVSQLGRKIILPISFTGGPRYMAEKYQDAMAICRWYGNPNLFITVTANPNWECSFLELLLVKGIKKQETASMINEYISAEWPDKDVDPEGFALIERHMIHGPWECTKAYPKPLSDHIHIDKSRFFIYRRSLYRKCLVMKGETELGNQNVAHINFEWCCRTTSWRLFVFHIHHNQPNVIKLPVHLPGQHRTVFDESANLEEAIGREDIEKTMLTSWFVACETYEEARELTYVELPTRFVYHTSGKLWTPRKMGGAIGRVVYISPAAGDVYFLRILVNVVRGPRSFQEEACYARGLLDDDREWHDAIEEPSYWATGRQLRRLFVIIILFCQVINPLKLWDHTWKFLAEDILYMKRRDLLQTTLTFHRLTEISNTMLRQELSYDIQQETETHKELFEAMNQDQRSVYDAMLESVDSQSGQLFFVYGAGELLRSSSKVFIPVASSGIAALLLPGGRTTHSRFKLPLTLSDLSMCNIPRSSMLASLIAKSDLIIWDEGPMAHHTVLASINKSYLWKNAKVYTLSINMRLREEDRDFANWILKVGDGNSDIVSSHSSENEEGEQIAKYLTERAVLTPTSNTVHEINAYMLSQVPSQAKEYLSCNSVELEATPEDDWTSHYTQEYLNSLEFSGLPNHRLNLKWRAVGGELRLAEQGARRLSSMGETVTGVIGTNCRRVRFQRASIGRSDAADLVGGRAPRESGSCERHVDEPVLQNLSLAQIADVSGAAGFYGGVERHVSELGLQGSSEMGIAEDPVLSSFGERSLHDYKRRISHLQHVGSPVMMLHNLNQAYGLCNGTRMIVTRVGDKVVEVEIMTGTKVGEQLLIPRLRLSPLDTLHPFTFCRRQYPLRLCYAMTINKSQVHSLKQAALYLPRPFFIHGQLYVALSRVTSPGS